MRNKVPNQITEYLLEDLALGSFFTTFMKNTAKKMAGYCKLIYGNNNSLTGTFLLSS